MNRSDTDAGTGGPPRPEHVLVIGAGLAAVSLCAALRDGGFAGRVTVVGDEPWPPYDRPPLSKQYLAGERTLSEIALQPPDWYSEQNIEVRRGVVVAIDPAACRAELADGPTLAADAVVLATGGRARRLAVPGGESAAVLRTRADAERLRGALVPGARLLIAGAGLIGGEVAATATSHDCRVTLVDPSPLPMEKAVGPHAARGLHAQHANHGVTTVQGGVLAMEPGEVELSTGLRMPADLVLAAIGITVNTELAQDAGLEVDDGVVVDAGMRTSVEHVYAIGDIARIAGARHRSEHWDNARRTAQAAARSILGVAPQTPPAPWFWTDRYGAHFEMTGSYDPGAEAVRRGDIEAGDGTVFYLRDARCVGAVTLRRPLDIRAAQRMIDRGLTVDAARLADEATDLRKLLASRG